jgi:MFS family permease
MNPKRLTLGALLPVPIYCLASAVYGLNGLIRHPENIPMLMVIWLGYGYLIMGIPSIIYSFAMEALRSKENASLAVCSVIGAVFGFLSGSLCFLLESQPIIFYTMSIPGAIIGGVIPIFLSIIFKVPD